jgi:hypothetical protein
VVRRLTTRSVAHLVLAGLSLVGAGQMARSAARDFAAPVTRIDDRYRDVLAGVSQDAALGYVSDLPRDLGDGDYRFYERYYQAQYACAPRLLLDSVDQPLLLIEVADASSIDTTAATLGLRVVRRSSNGLVAVAVRLDSHSRRRTREQTYVSDTLTHHDVPSERHVALPASRRTAPPGASP